MTSNLDARSANIDALLAFARYLSWADLQATLLEEEMGRGPDPTDCEAGTQHKWRWFGLMSHWYASLYVVVEGWDDLQFSDPVVDRLLAHPTNIRALLRKYRNGVFHYQRSLLSPKLMELLQVGATSVYWVQALHNEFLRFLADSLDKLVVSDEQRAELRAAVEKAVEWYPHRQHPGFDSLERTLTRARQTLAKYGDDQSEHRQALERAIRETKTILAKARTGWALVRAAMLRDAGVDPA